MSVPDITGSRLCRCPFLSDYSVASFLPLLIRMSLLETLSSGRVVGVIESHLLRCTMLLYFERQVHLGARRFDFLHYLVSHVLGIERKIQKNLAHGSESSVEAILQKYNTLK